MHLPTVANHNDAEAGPSKRGRRGAAVVKQEPEGGCCCFSHAVALILTPAAIQLGAPVVACNLPAMLVLRFCAISPAAGDGT